MTTLIVLAILAQAGDEGHRKVYDATVDSVVAVRAFGATNEERSGSGVVLTKDGLVLVSCSVVPAAARNIRVWLKGPRLCTAEVVGTSERDEVTLLRIKPKEELKPIEFGESRKARIGDVVYTLGNASNSQINNDQPSFNVGVISATYRLDEPRAGARYKGTVFETTAAVNVGIEGGPLLDAGGRMIGLLTLNYSPHRFLGTAIPIDDLKRTIERLKEAKPPSAVKPEDPPPEEVEGYFGAQVADQEGKLVVDAVDAGSPAETAGLRQGIVIVAAGDRKFKDAADFAAFVKELKAGALLVLTIDEDGLQSELKITLEKKK